ncbi:MAG TPA: YihY/virulence factor BrkB family protein [Terriglobia bacterium]
MQVDRPGAAAGRVVPSFGERFRWSLGYLWTTEVHAYAFSIAANALLAFFPFTLLLITICHSWLRWQGAYDMIVTLLRANLPTGADFVIRNLAVVVRARRQVQVVSVLLLFVTSSGVFLPLEVALNKVWGIRRDRSYLGNVAVSVMLTVGVALMAFGSVALGAVTASMFPGALDRLPWPLLGIVLTRATLETISVPLMIGIFFATYYALPHGKVPLERVFPAAVCAALLTEAVRFAFAWLLPWFHFPEVYGPFAVSATLLIWAFIGSLILLWGASFFACGHELDGLRQTDSLAARGRILRLEL